MKNRKIALITGASRGIGAATAIELAGNGFDIWINYKSNRPAAEQVAEAVGSLGVDARLLPFDVTDAKAVENELAPLLEQHTPAVLVNNAGFSRDVLMAWMTRREWTDVLSVSLDGFFLVTKMVLTPMLRKRFGRIVNIVSTSGQSGMPGQTNYSAAKGGVIGATRSLAVEIAKRNVLVNAVSPGFIETEMTEHLQAEMIIPRIPLGRFGSPQEVANVIGFLCSEEASYITGQTIAVNGGIHM